jgi:murein DD-endopeptidase MepM/ murein hydrolase activator NlpD
MALLDSAAVAPKSTEDVSREMEALLVKQMLKASGAFHQSKTAGSNVTADLFIDTLSDAIAKSGQLGIGKALAREIGKPVPPTPSLAPAVGSGPGAAAGAAAGSLMRPVAAQLNAASAHATPSPASGATPGVAAALNSAAGYLGTSAPTSPTPVGPGLAAALTAAPNHLTSGFGLRADPFNGHLEQHQGIDLGAPEGTPILAAADGVVQSAGLRGGYGQAVVIRHAGGISTLYGHASALMVQPGQHVTKGQTIGLVGQTGKATGPHLHFEVRVGHRPVDPSHVLKAYGQRADSTEK